MIEKVLVTLNKDEMRQAAHAGIERRLHALEHGRRSTHPDTPDHLQRWYQSEIVGALGEYAVAKAFGTVWDPAIGRVNAHDVLNYEVRTTEQPKPVLRYRTHNDPRNKYILCQSRGNQILIHGWQIGQTIMDLGYMEYDDVYTAGPDQLYSIFDLPVELEFSDTVKLYRPHARR